MLEKSPCIFILLKWPAVSCLVTYELDWMHTYTDPFAHKGRRETDTRRAVSSGCISSKNYLDLIASISYQSIQCKHQARTP